MSTISTVADGFYCLAYAVYQLAVYLDESKAAAFRKRVAADPVGVLLAQLNPDDGDDVDTDTAGSDEPTGDDESGDGGSGGVDE